METFLLQPLHYGTAEPFRVSPPEAVAYLLRAIPVSFEIFFKRLPEASGQ
jgi:hypothetical protein